MGLRKRTAIQRSRGDEQRNARTAMPRQRHRGSGRAAQVPNAGIFKIPKLSSAILDDWVLHGILVFSLFCVVVCLIVLLQPRSPSEERRAAEWT